MNKIWKESIAKITFYWVNQEVVKVKQRQLSRVWISHSGITALIQYCVTLIEKQYTELDRFPDKQSFPPALIIFMTY